MKLHHISQFPENTFNLPAEVINLEYSQHALSRSAERNVTLPATINLGDFKVIEIEFSDNGISKLFIRGPYSQREDILIALIPGRNFVKTCWTNRKNDHHKTLDMSKYDSLN